MRKILISAMLLSAVSISAPAAAQFRGGQGYGQGANIERQLDQIEQQIDRLRDRRAISNNEARQLMWQAEQIDRLHDRFARNGLTQYERRDLQNRIQNLRQRVQAERHEGRADRRDDRRDRW
jgi:hypothetical protein